MCLKVDREIKPLKPNKEGFCIGWKNLNKDNHAWFKRNFEYKTGINYSSRPSNINTKNTSYVYKGFHLWLSRSSAREFKKYQYPQTKIIKVFYKPDDVINYGWSQGIKSVVVHKVTVKSLKAL